MTNREALDMPSFDEGLDDFGPRQTRAGGGAPPAGDATARRSIDAVSTFPSREAPPDGQLNLKGPKPVLDRFRALCREERRPYYDMLTILMDQYDAR